mgnify:FL=1
MTLTPDGYRHRLVEKDVSESLRAFGAVLIVGPKYCGKTWVASDASNSAFMMGGINEYGVSNKSLAESDICMALEGESPHMIDEWQEVPRIWDAVRSEVDARASKGLFILTGSSTPLRKDSAPVHSGTGRIRRLRMRTMSLVESGDSTGSISLKSIMNGEDIGTVKEGTSLERLVELVIRGGWPGNLSLSFNDSANAVRGYVDSIVEDACNLDDVRRKGSLFRPVLRSLARNESTLANLSKLQNDTGVLLNSETPILDGETIVGRPAISYNSLVDYMDVLNRLYLLDNMPAFDPHLKSSIRVGKAIKRHFTDPSLAAAILGVKKERLMKDPLTFGYLFEALCERDLQIYARFMDANLFHYRDGKGLEVDAIIEMEDGRWGAFEIKLGADKIDEAAANLLEFKDAMERRGASALPSVLCVICGLTGYGYRRSDGVYVVPITSLGP